MNELGAAEQYLYQALTAAEIPGIGAEVYSGAADEDAADFCVVFVWQGGPSVNSVGGEVDSTHLVYLVKVYDRHSSRTWADLQPAVDAVDAALQAAGPREIDGVFIEGCVRHVRGPAQDFEIDGGVRYNWRGAHYYLPTQPMPGEDLPGDGLQNED